MAKRKSTKGRVSSSCSTSDTRRVNLVTNLVIRLPDLLGNAEKLQQFVSYTSTTRFTGGMLESYNNLSGENLTHWRALVMSIGDRLYVSDLNLVIKS